MIRRIRFFTVICLVVAVYAAPTLDHVNLASPQGGTANLPNPIMFVTQVPIPSDFTTVASVFGNHRGIIDSAPRGGDLYILYPDATVKNLTATVGYGTSGFQGDTGIAVREPSVHWSGTKAIFSMVIGTPPQYQHLPYYWQLYEVTGLGRNETPVITKVPNQPENFNNVSPIYGSDDRIIFSSDMPRNGQRHLYPQLDEYESAPTVTGLWSLDPATGDLFLMNHSPSGVFSPIVDSFGRVIFTRWDHLQRDQQADTDVTNPTYGSFTYSSEAADAARLDNRDEVFPEPRDTRRDLLQGTNLEGHTINHFFPWQLNEDGTEEETLNHVGRHELHSYFNRSLNDDENLREFSGAVSGRVNENSILNMLQIKEDPTRPGLFFGIDAPEFDTHAAGQIISIEGSPTTNADFMKVNYLTPRSTAGFTDDPDPSHPGHYRNPVPMSDGLLIAVHAPESRRDENDGTREAPMSRYRFRLKSLKKSGDFWAVDQLLTPGFTKSVSYYDPDVMVSYSGELWELDPVEVRPHPRPQRRTPALDAPERQVLNEENVDVNELVAFMRRNNLALVVSRNVTTRDYNDRQQPFNLRIAGTQTQSVPTPGKVYDIAHIQFFQGDQIRGYGGTADPGPGRRVLARLMHDPAAVNPPNPSGPLASVKLGDDGSMAAFVPARRAMTWQLTDPSGNGVVRERYWLTFQPGEIRTCTSCHGLNTRDQMERPTPANKPEALRQLARFYRQVSKGR